MCIVVVHHQCNFFCFLIMVGYFFQKKCPVLFGFSFSDSYNPFPSQRFTGYKDVAHSTSSIFIVMFSWLSRFCFDRNLIFCNKLLWRFIHTYQRVQWVERTPVHIKDHFHLRHKVAILLWRNHPSFSLPWLDFVFFKTWR